MAMPSWLTSGRFQPLEYNNNIHMIYMMAITLSSQMMMTYTSYSLPVNQKQTNAHEVRGHSLVAKDLLHFKIVTTIMFC